MGCQRAVEALHAVGLLGIRERGQVIVRAIGSRKRAGSRFVAHVDGDLVGSLKNWIMKEEQVENGLTWKLEAFGS